MAKCKSHDAQIELFKEEDISLPKKAAKKEKRKAVKKKEIDPSKEISRYIYNNFLCKKPFGPEIVKERTLAKKLSEKYPSISFWKSNPIKAFETLAFMYSDFSKEALDKNWKMFNFDISSIRVNGESKTEDEDVDFLKKVKDRIKKEPKNIHEFITWQKE